jgi:hypothetical protein
MLCHCALPAAERCASAAPESRSVAEAVRRRLQAVVRRGALARTFCLQPYPTPPPCGRDWHVLACSLVRRLLPLHESEDGASHRWPRDRGGDYHLEMACLGEQF